MRLQTIQDVIKSPFRFTRQGRTSRSRESSVRVLAVACMLALSVVTSGTATPVSGLDGRLVVPFALPANTTPTKTWAQQRDRFAAKLHQAFGISEATATEFSGWILEASERHDEIGQLQRAFNRMARDLESTLTGLVDHWFHSSKSPRPSPSESGSRGFERMMYSS